MQWWKNTIAELLLSYTICGGEECCGYTVSLFDAKSGEERVARATKGVIKPTAFTAECDTGWISGH